MMTPAGTQTARTLMNATAAGPTRAIQCAVVIPAIPHAVVIPAIPHAVVTPAIHPAVVIPAIQDVD